MFFLYETLSIIKPQLPLNPLHLSRSIMIHLNSSHLSGYSYEILYTVILLLARSRLQSTLILPYSFNKSLPSVTKLSMMAFVEKYSISSRQRFGRFLGGHWPCPLKCTHLKYEKRNIQRHGSTWEKNMEFHQTKQTSQFYQSSKLNSNSIPKTSHQK